MALVRCDKEILLVVMDIYHSLSYYFFAHAIIYHSLASLHGVTTIFRTWFLDSRKDAWSSPGKSISFKRSPWAHYSPRYTGMAHTPPKTSKPLARYSPRFYAGTAKDASQIIKGLKRGISRNNGAPAPPTTSKPFNFSLHIRRTSGRLRTLDSRRVRPSRSGRNRVPSGPTAGQQQQNGLQQKGKKNQWGFSFLIHEHSPMSRPNMMRGVPNNWDKGLHKNVSKQPKCRFWEPSEPSEPWPSEPSPGRKTLTHEHSSFI